MTIVDRQLRRAGDRGWLVDLEPHRIPAWIAAVQRSDWRGLLQDIVPAAASILFVAHRRHDMGTVEAHIAELLSDSSTTVPPDLVQGSVLSIPVVYDGEDIDDVAAATGMSVEAVATSHAASDHVVGFFGFAPGFAYIDGSPERLALPRRTSPRPRVAAGSIAIAGTQTVVYPGGTPGGWHVIGHTDAVLWNIEWDNPSRVAVGDRVVFDMVGR